MRLTFNNTLYGLPLEINRLNVCLLNENFLNLKKNSKSCPIYSESAGQRKLIYEWKGGDGWEGKIGLKRVRRKYRGNSKQ